MPEGINSKGDIDTPCSLIPCSLLVPCSLFQWTKWTQWTKWAQETRNQGSIKRGNPAWYQQAGLVVNRLARSGYRWVFRYALTLIKSRMLMRPLSSASAL